MTDYWDVILRVYGEVVEDVEKEFVLEEALKELSEYVVIKLGDDKYFVTKK